MTSTLVAFSQVGTLLHLQAQSIILLLQLKTATESNISHTNCYASCLSRFGSVRGTVSVLHCYYISCLAVKLYHERKPCTGGSRNKGNSVLTGLHALQEAQQELAGHQAALQQAQSSLKAMAAAAAIHKRCEKLIAFVCNLLPVVPNDYGRKHCHLDYLQPRA